MDATKIEQFDFLTTVGITDNSRLTLAVDRGDAANKNVSALICIQFSELVCKRFKILNLKLISIAYWTRLVILYLQRSFC